MAEDLNNRLYGFHLKSSYQGHHVGGSDRLGSYDEIKDIAREMIDKLALGGRNVADEIVLKIETLSHFDVSTARLPDMMTVSAGSWRDSRKTARKILLDAGVSAEAFDAGLALLTASCAQGAVSLHGALLLDAVTGARLDQQENGIWIGRFDMTDRVRQEVEREFYGDPLRVQEWLVSSAKVLAMPGLAAEMLLSSDATDRGGMVATPELGVVYFPQLRSRESEVGGRVLFVRPTGFDLEKVTRYLESSVLLIDAMGKIR